MVVWIQNPFDSLPAEGSRKMRYWLLAEAFVRAGQRVTLWTSDFSHATKRKRVCGAGTGAVEKWGSGEVEKCGIELRFIPTIPYSRNVSLARIRSHCAYAAAWLKMAQDPSRSRPDLIVASTPTISGAEAALALGRRFGAKVAVDVMDAWPETFERLAPRPLRGLAHLALTSLRRRVRRVYRDADLVTGVCDRYRELTGRADYHLAYHGIELGSRESSSPSRHSSPSRPEPAPRPGPLRLVYAGNLGRTYDLATVVKAVEADPGLTLDVAGFGAFESDCPRVRFHGRLTEAGLQALFASCDVGVIPMPTESWVGVPYKFCDYARAGLKIVSSLGGETSALLSRYRCGATYRAGDAASFAAAVKAVAPLPSGASRRMCEALFDAVRIYDGYVRYAVASFAKTTA